MASEAPLLNWTSITDFSPGIYQVAGTNHPLGAATDDSWGWVAAENGALIPGPKLDLQVSHEAFESDPASIASEDQKYWVGGIHANAGAVYGGPGNPYPGPDQNNTELYVGFEYYKTNGTHRRIIKRYRRNYADPTARWETLVDVSDSATPSEYTRPLRLFAAATRSNPASPTTAGIPVTAFTYNGGATAVVFPNPTTPGVTGTSALPYPAGGILHMLTGHQGRIVCTPLTIYGAGNGQVHVSNEAIYWTPVQDHTQLDSELGGKYFNVVAGFEHPSGYADMVSLTADELFLLKIKGGALVLRGSLNDPQVVTLPFVQSPGISMCKGAVTPVGYVYPVKAGGLWVWVGGDTSEYVSPQMNPAFWEPHLDYFDETVPEATYHWHFADCATWHEWVVLPGSWLWDWRKKAFYRIAKSDFWFYATSADARYLYAARPRFDNSNLRVFSEWDRTQGERRWRFTSQFIPGTVRNQVRVREIEVVASGHGTVAVTAMVAENDGTTTREWPVKVFEVSSDEPTVIGRMSCDVQGTHLQFRMIGEAHDTSLETGGPAPSVYDLRFAVQETKPAMGRG